MWRRLQEKQRGITCDSTAVIQRSFRRYGWLHKCAVLSISDAKVKTAIEGEFCTDTLRCHE